MSLPRKVDPAEAVRQFEAGKLFVEDLTDEENEELYVQVTEMYDRPMQFESVDAESLEQLVQRTQDRLNGEGDFA